MRVHAFIRSGNLLLAPLPGWGFCNLSPIDQVISMTSWKAHPAASFLHPMAPNQSVCCAPPGQGLLVTGNYWRRVCVWIPWHRADCILLGWGGERWSSAQLRKPRETEQLCDSLLLQQTESFCNSLPHFSLQRAFGVTPLCKSNVSSVWPRSKQTSALGSPIKGQSVLQTQTAVMCHPPEALMTSYSLSKCSFKRLRWKSKPESFLATKSWSLIQKIRGCLSSGKCSPLSWLAFIFNAASWKGCWKKPFPPGHRKWSSGFQLGSTGMLSSGSTTCPQDELTVQSCSMPQAMTAVPPRPCRAVGAALQAWGTNVAPSWAHTQCWHFAAHETWVLFVMSWTQISQHFPAFRWCFLTAFLC